MSTHLERLGNYEDALDTLADMVGWCSRAMQQERQKAAPDEKKISELLQEMKGYINERNNLDLNDEAGVARVLDKYTPIIKANYEKLCQHQI